MNNVMFLTCSLSDSDEDDSSASRIWSPDIVAASISKSYVDIM